MCWFQSLSDEMEKKYAASPNGNANGGFAPPCFPQQPATGCAFCNMNYVGMKNIRRGDQVRIPDVKTQV